MSNVLGINVETGKVVNSDSSVQYLGDLAGGGAAVEVAYSANVDLSKNTVMPTTTIDSATAFQPAVDAIAGASSLVVLVGDGSITPTFPGFRKVVSSGDYDNTLGELNLVQFFTTPSPSGTGVDYWYSVTQDAGAGAVDRAAPTLSSAVIATTTSGIALTFNENMSYGPPSTPAVGDFSIVASPAMTVTSVTRTSPTVWTLGLSRDAVEGESVSLTYAAGSSARLRDVAYNNYVPSNPISVTNNINSIEDILFVANGELRNIGEVNPATGAALSGSQLWGSIAPGGNFTNSYSKAERYLASGSTGWVEWGWHPTAQYQGFTGDLGGSGGFGIKEDTDFTDSATAGGGSNAGADGPYNGSGGAYTLFVYVAGSVLYRQAPGGGSAISLGAVDKADRVRIRRDGRDLIVEKDAGATGSWATLTTMTNLLSSAGAQAYPFLNLNTCRIFDPKISGGTLL